MSASSNSNASAAAQKKAGTSNSHPSATSALSLCMHKQGVDIAAIKPGEQPAPPAGVSVAKFHEALLRCGIPTVGIPVAPTTGQVPLFQGRYTGAHLHEILDRFEQCLRAHGVVIPHNDVAGKELPLPTESSANEQKLIDAERACFPIVTNELKLKVKPRFNPGGTDNPNRGL